MRSDTDIRRDIEAELESDPSVSGVGAIRVAVDGGVATLVGQIATADERSAAETAAKRVRGVTAVVNNIDVRWTSLGL